MEEADFIVEKENNLITIDLNKIEGWVFDILECTNYECPTTEEDAINSGIYHDMEVLMEFVSHIGINFSEIIDKKAMADYKVREELIKKYEYYNLK